MHAGIRTAGLFTVLTLLFVGIGAAVGFLVDRLWVGMLIMIILSVILNLYAYFGSKRAVMRRHRVKVVTEADQPRLYRIVKGLSEKSGLPMPEVGIMNNPSPNAFATGRNPKNSIVVATTGLLDLLDDSELEGVMAHELAHVKNRDVLIMSVAATVAGVISYLSTYLLWAGLLQNNRDNGAALAVGLIAYLTLPLAAMFVQLGISRGREFEADRVGATFTGDPLALASALRRLEGGIARTPINNAKYKESNADAHLWIEAPAAKGKGGVSSMFSTHPPIALRIQKLEAMAPTNNPFKE